MVSNMEEAKKKENEQMMLNEILLRMGLVKDINPQIQNTQKIPTRTDKAVRHTSGDCWSPELHSKL